MIRFSESKHSGRQAGIRHSGVHTTLTVLLAVGHKFKLKNRYCEFKICPRTRKRKQQRQQQTTRMRTIIALNTKTCTLINWILLRSPNIAWSLINLDRNRFVSVFYVCFDWSQSFCHTSFRFLNTVVQLKEKEVKFHSIVWCCSGWWLCSSIRNSFNIFFCIFDRKHSIFQAKTV